MFIFEDDYTFDWPVAVRYPGAGGEAEAMFTARFRLVDEDELLTRTDPEMPVIEAMARDREMWAGRLVGWSGISTPDGRELAFTPEARDKLLRQRPVREAVARAYYDAVFGGGQREKN